MPFPPELTNFDCERLENAYPLFRDTGLVRALKDAIRRVEELEAGGGNADTDSGLTFQLNSKIKVPAHGTLYLRDGEVATSSASIVAMKAMLIEEVSISVDQIDASRAFDLVAYVNGAPTTLLALTAAISGTVPGLSLNFPIGGTLALALVRVSGTGKSVFKNTQATLILTGE